MPRASFCLSMIVKDEAPVIERCLTSVLPYIDAWVVIDTGSADGTRDIVRAMFARAGLPGVLLERPWRDFATNRTEALQAARGRADYTLVIDADDVLEILPGTDLRSLTGDAYAATLIDGTLRYTRKQIVRSALNWSYRGVLHEFLVCSEAQRAEVLPGLLMHRNHDGARRRDADTYARDAALLESALATETDEHLRLRYTYYLGQSYRDAHEPQKAAAAFARRADMPGWEEERWHARLQAGRCMLEAGDESGFLKATAQAYTERPQRLEPLIDLARFFRDRQRYAEAMQAIKLAATLPYPEPGALFIDDYAYRVGIRQELSVAGYFSENPADRQLGRAAANSLALDRTVPVDARGYARLHLTYYAPPLAELCPSWRSTRLKLDPPAGYVAMNPSICRAGARLWCIMRTVNFDASDGVNYVVPDKGPVITRNFLCRLSEDFAIETGAEIGLPAEFATPKNRRVFGIEDMRLLYWQDRLWSLGTVRQLNEAAIYEMVLGELVVAAGETRIGEWRVLDSPTPGRHEKNWTPACRDGELRFLYTYDPALVLRDDASPGHTATPALALDHLRGGTPAIPFDDGWLSLTHEVQLLDDRRLYLHRFVRLDQRLCPIAVSEPFYFHAKGLEFAAGLCWTRTEQTLAVSFGARDAEAWVGTVDAAEVRQALAWSATDDGPVHRRGTSASDT